MPNNGINKAIATVNAVAKKSVRTFGNVLPIMTVGINVVQAIQDYPNDPVGAGKRLVRNYTGVHMDTGQFSTEPLAKGLGTLVMGLAGRAVIRWLT